MSSSDEPIFLETDTGWGTGNFVAPGAHYYVGVIPEAEIPGEMPVLYLEWQVALTLQAEGQRSIQTDKEVAGILLGTCSGDYETIRVSHIAIARDEDSSPVHFKFTFSVWDDLIDQMESMSREAGEELLLLGWYHTHPNMAVFLSRYDLLTHRDFHRPYQFALVLAPQVGTADTSVGYFCNRDGGTPLLPGIRLFGAIPRGEVAGRLPWRFQVLEVEGVEEGESVAEASNSSPVIPVVESEVQQLGIVRREAPEWLLLGEDVNEGPVLPILEQMAAKVVAEGEDQLGVLLGTQNAENHVVVTRVRFVGAMSASTQKEEDELLVALGFMARTFPGHGEEKIVGLVRVVAPQQFKAGDSYDPLTHNIRLPALLAQLGYDLDAVPFQVGLVLYPGIEEETFLFQVFAQHKNSNPLPLSSVQAVAPAAMRANERYEPICEPIFEVEVEPCLKAPDVLWVGRQSRRDEHIIQTRNDNPVVRGSGIPEGAAATGTINWDDVEDDPGERHPPSGLPLVVILMAILLFLVAVLLVVQLTDPFTPDALPEEESMLLLDADIAAQGNPFEYEIVGCGEGWSLSEACRPTLAEDSSGRLEFLHLRALDFYTEQSIESPEAWLVPGEDDDRPRLRLEARGEGHNYSFSVSRRHPAWVQFWGAGTAFSVSLVMAPRGAELLAVDELTYLRRSVEMEMDGSGLVSSEPATAEFASEAVATPLAEDANDVGPGLWGWHNIGARHQASYDVGRQSFSGTLQASGGVGVAGDWRLEYRLSEDKASPHSIVVNDVGLRRGKVDLSQVLTRLMRDPAVVASLETESASDEASVTIQVNPPGQGATSVMILEVALKGAAAASSVRHRVCVMLSGPEGGSLEGQARISTQGEMRTTFEPGSEGGKCADGGNSGRWTEADFGPEQTELRFVYLGSAPDSEAARGKEQHYPIPPQWTSTKPSCIAVTVHLDLNGWQAKPPTFNALYRLVDGRCQ